MTSMDRTEQGQTATTAIKIHDREIEFAASFRDNLQRVADASCDQNDRPHPEKSFGQNLVEARISGVEENQSWLHRDLCCVQLGVAGGKPSDCSVSGDRLPVT